MIPRKPNRKKQEGGGQFDATYKYKYKVWPKYKIEKE